MNIPTTVIAAGQSISTPRLLVQERNGLEREIFLHQGTLRVGRADDNDIVLPAEGVSRYHAQIRWDGASVQITDSDSSNGSQLDGWDIPAHQFTTWMPGSVVRIGEVYLRLTVPSHAAAPTQILAAPAAPIQPVPGLPVAVNHANNSSGMGRQAVVPPEIGGLNVGAFLMTPIWALAHGLWLVFLLALIPYVCVIVWFVALFKGNEWAWRSKRWRDVDHFQQRQRAWTYAAIALTVIFSVVTILLVISGY
jgi:hypothetical protein